MNDQEKLAALLHEDDSYGNCCRCRVWVSGDGDDEIMYAVPFPCSFASGVRVAPSPDAPGLREAAQTLVDHLGSSYAVRLDNRGGRLVRNLRAALAASGDAPRELDVERLAEAMEAESRNLGTNFYGWDVFAVGVAERLSESPKEPTRG